MNTIHAAVVALVAAIPTAYAHDGEIFEPAKGFAFSGIGNSKQDADKFELAAGTFKTAHEKLYIPFDVQTSHPIVPANFLNKLNKISNQGQIPQLGLDFKGFHPTFLPMDQAISLGLEDPFLDLLAGLIKQYDKPIFILPGFEFNLVGYTPGIFPAAFEHIVERFRFNGVKNVAWVWNAFIDSSTAPTQYDEVDMITGEPLWLPDPDDVNYFAMNIFFADAWIPGSTSPNAMVMNNFLDFAALHNKPVLYAETTSFIGLDIFDTSDPLAAQQATFLWNNHFSHLFSNINAFDRIKGFTYISANWPTLGNPLWLTWGDHTIQNNNFLLQMFINELQTGNYLNANPNLPHPWVPWTKQIASIGSNVEVEINNLPAGAPAALFLSPFRLPDGVNIGGIEGDWFLAPPVIPLITLPAGPDGKILIAGPLPNDPNLIGFELYLQWVSAQGAPKPMKLVIQ